MLILINNTVRPDDAFHGNPIKLFKHQKNKTTSSKISKKTNLGNKDIKTIDQSIEKYIKDLNQTLFQIDEIKLYQIPAVKLPQIMEETMYLSKKKINTRLIQSILLENKDKYPNYINIYTDGSKSANGTGCAIIVEEEEEEIITKLPTVFSVFSSEAYAILKALNYIENSTKIKFIINTDSKSVINATQNKKTTNPFIRSILEVVTKLKTKHILLQWIPSHLGIRGNERADAAAKRAVELKNPITIPIFNRDLKFFNKTNLKSQVYKKQKNLNKLY